MQLNITIGRIANKQQAQALVMALLKKVYDDEPAFFEKFEWGVFEGDQTRYACDAWTPFDGQFTAEVTE